MEGIGCDQANDFSHLGPSGDRTRYLKVRVQLHLCKEIRIPAVDRFGGSSFVLPGLHAHFFIRHNSPKVPKDTEGDPNPEKLVRRNKNDEQRVSNKRFCGRMTTNSQLTTTVLFTLV